LTWSKKTETGQHWNEIDPSTKKVRGLPKTKEGKVDKAEVRKAKEDSAQEVKEALEAAKTAYPEQAPESK